MQALVIHETESRIPAHERNWAVGVHVGVLILAVMTSWFAGFAGMLGAGIVILARPLGSEFVVEHAKEAFNFNFSLFVYCLAAGVFSIMTLGLGLILAAPFWIVLAIMWLVCSIQAAARASEGLSYRYPLTWRVWQ